MVSNGILDDENTLKERIKTLRKSNPSEAKKLENLLKKKKQKKESTTIDYNSLISREETPFQVPEPMEDEPDSSDQPSLQHHLHQVLSNFALLESKEASNTLLDLPSYSPTQEPSQPAYSSDTPESLQLEHSQEPSLNTKRKNKKKNQPTVAQLKEKTNRPDLVEVWDTTAADPSTLIFLKSVRSAVSVPVHWSWKSRYLSKKRAVEKPMFVLPDYIQDTGIARVRQAIQEKEARMTLKQKQREKARPRAKKMDINYQVLHDAFFKYGLRWKPKLSGMGDLYFEGKEQALRMKHFIPGKLSERLQLALGMVNELSPPPYLFAMQRFGPPQAYPKLRIPGVNARLPPGALYGNQIGGWGMPPTDSSGRAIHADRDTLDDVRAQLEIEQDKNLWGEIDERLGEEREEREEREEEEGEGEVEKEEGLAPPPDIVVPDLSGKDLINEYSGGISISQYQKMLQNLHQKSGDSMGMDTPLSVLPSGGMGLGPQKLVPMAVSGGGGQLMPSTMVYAFPSAGDKGEGTPSLDPEQLRHQLRSMEQRNVQAHKLAGLVPQAVEEHENYSKDNKQMTLAGATEGGKKKKKKDFKF